MQLEMTISFVHHSTLIVTKNIQTGSHISMYYM